MKPVISTAAASTRIRRQLAVALGAVAIAAAALAIATPAGAADANPAYNQHCLVCHGTDLQGVANLGVELTDSKFVAVKSVEELTEFLKIGRMPGDPDTVSNGAMPGFAWVSEDELRSIAEFLKSR